MLVTQAELDEIAQIARDVYQFDPGTSTPGTIDFEEFLIIVAGQKNTSCNKRELLRAFRIFADPNLPSGYIHPKSLKEALIQYHPNIDEKEAEKLVGQLLTTSDGLINYADEVDIFLT